MKEPHHILFRYLLTFFIFALFLIILFVPIYFFIFNFYFQNEINFINSRLENGLEHFDRSINSLNNLVSIANTDPKFSYLKMNYYQDAFDPRVLVELRIFISNLLAQNNLVADAGFIYSRDSILTRQRIFYHTDFYKFYETFLSCHDYSEDEWLNLISEGRSFTQAKTYTSLDYQTYDAITYTAMRYHSGNQEQNIFFAAIPISRILDLLFEEDIIKHASISLYDMYGQILYKNNNVIEENYRIMENAASNYVHVKLHIPVDLITEKVIPIRNRMLSFALLILSMGIILSLLFAYKSAKPLQNLILWIKNSGSMEFNNYDSFFPPAFKQVYSNIEQSFSSIDEKLKNSLQSIDYLKERLKIQIFEKALYKGIYDLTEANEFFSVFSDFPSRFRMELIFWDTSESGSFDIIASSQLDIIKKIKEDIPNYYFHTTNWNSIVFLFSIKGSSSDPWLGMLKEVLLKQSELPLIFFSGDIYEKPHELNLAWRHLEYLRTYSDIENPLDKEHDKRRLYTAMPLSIVMLDMLHTALSNGNEDSALAILNQCGSSLSFPEDYAISAIVYNLLSTLVAQLKLEYPDILENITLPEYHQGKQKRMIETDFTLCFKMICKQIQNRKERNINKFGNRVINYINDHIFDAEFYSTVVMDEFNISQPTLQKIMKINTGQTFLSYVEKERLTKAHNMLLEGLKPVQEIARNCGFSSVNGFYKAFKRRYACSPSNIGKA